MKIAIRRISQLRISRDIPCATACPILNATIQKVGAFISLIACRGTISPNDTVSNSAIALVEPTAYIAGDIAIYSIIVNDTIAIHKSAATRRMISKSQVPRDDVVFNGPIASIKAPAAVGRVALYEIFLDCSVAMV